MLGEMESRAGIAPASWWPCASTFANRRLNCSANGIEIKSAGESFRLRPRCLPLGVLKLFAIREQSSRLEFGRFESADWAQMLGFDQAAAAPTMLW